MHGEKLRAVLGGAGKVATVPVTMSSRQLRAFFQVFGQDAGLFGLDTTVRAAAQE
jgi:hypothetical protein